MSSKVPHHGLSHKRFSSEYIEVLQPPRNSPLFFSVGRHCCCCRLILSLLKCSYTFHRTPSEKPQDALGPVPLWTKTAAADHCVCVVVSSFEHAFHGGSSYEIRGTLEDDDFAAVPLLDCSAELPPDCSLAASFTVCNSSAPFPSNYLLLPLFPSVHLFEVFTRVSHVFSFVCLARTNHLIWPCRALISAVRLWCGPRLWRWLKRCANGRSVCVNPFTAHVERKLQTVCSCNYLNA
jgi:hypothetical protein